MQSLINAHSDDFDKSNDDKEYDFNVNLEKKLTLGVSLVFIISKNLNYLKFTVFF